MTEKLQLDQQEIIDIVKEAGASVDRFYFEKLARMEAKSFIAREEAERMQRELDNAREQAEKIEADIQAGKAKLVEIIDEAMQTGASVEELSNRILEELAK